MAQDDEALRRRIAELKRQGLSREQVRETILRERDSVSRATPQRAPAESTMARPTPTGGVDRTSQAGSFARGLARSAAGGLTLGAADEVEGFVRGVLPGGHSIRERTDAIRGEQRAFREQHPVAAIAAELAGGLVPVGGALQGAKVIGKGAKSVGLGTQIRRGAGTGLAVGSTSGFLSGEGEGRLPSALFGGVAGTALGAGAPVVGAAVSRVNPRGVVDDIAESVRRVTGNERGAVRMSRNPDAVERMGREFFGGRWGRPEQRAVQLAVSRAERDGIDLQQALREVAGLEGRPMVAADFGGEGTRRLLGAAESIPSEATSGRDFLNARAVNRPARMADDVSRGTGTEPVNLTTRAQEIRAEEAPVIDRLYGEAREAGTRVPVSVPTHRALTTPETQRAYQRAQAATTEAAPTRGRRPLEPLTDTVEETVEEPLARVGEIRGSRAKDGRTVWTGGNPKFATKSIDQLEADYRAQLERIERGSQMEGQGARSWTREVSTNLGPAKLSGFAPKNEYGRGRQLGNVAERQAREIEAELVGRYRGMDPDALARRPTYAFEEMGGPIWTDMAEETLEGAPATRTVVTGTREQPRETLDLETLDAVKRQLDTRIAELEARPGVDRDLLASLVANRASIVADMDAASPAYRGARGFFEETARRQEAVGTGAELGKMRATPDEIAATLDPMSPLEVEEARRAAAQTLRQSMLDGGASRALDPQRALGRDQRTRALFGEDAATELERRTALERRMRETERAGGGSPTAGRLADQAEFGDEGVSPDRFAAFARNPFRESLNLGLRGAAKGYNKYLLGIRGETAGRVGDLLLGGREGPEQLEQVFRLLAAGREREAGRLAARLRAAGVVSNVAGQQGGR